MMTFLTGYDQSPELKLKKAPTIRYGRKLVLFLACSVMVHLPTLMPVECLEHAFFYKYSFMYS